MPRCTRIRRRFGPKASRSPMAATAVIAKTLPNSEDRELPENRGSGEPTRHFYTVPRLIFQQQVTVSVSVEFAFGRGLFRSDTSGDNVGTRVVFTFHLCAGQSAQHGQLSYM